MNTYCILDEQTVRLTEQLAQAFIDSRYDDCRMLLNQLRTVVSACQWEPTDVECTKLSTDR